MRFSIRFRYRRSAFTVLELTVVLCTIVILISLLLPAIQQAREQARRQQCFQNLAQIGIALRTYHDSHDCLPSGVVNATGPVRSRAFDQSIYGGSSGDFGAYGMGMGSYGNEYGGGYGEGDSDYGEGEDLPVDEELRKREIQRFSSVQSEYMLSWIAQILPQLGHKNTYRKIDFQIPHLSFVDKRAKAAWHAKYQEWTTLGDTSVPWFPEPRVTIISTLNCPSRWVRSSSDALFETNYSGCYSGSAVPINDDNDGLLYLNSSESLDEVPDGASTTILAGESPVGIFRSYYFGDHSSLRATSRASLAFADIDRYADHSLVFDGDETDDLDPTESKSSWGFSSAHNTVSQFLFADGSARPISNLIDAQVYSQLGSRNDGQVISSDRF